MLRPYRRQTCRMGSGPDAAFRAPLKPRSKALETCVVCGEPVDETDSAVCRGCGRRYHLVLRQGGQGKDCGAVWVDGEYLSLQFACFNCLGRGDDASSRAQPGAATPEPAPPGKAPAFPEGDAKAPPSHARRSRGQRRYRKW